MDGTVHMPFHLYISGRLDKLTKKNCQISKYIWSVNEVCFMMWTTFRIHSKSNMNFNNMNKKMRARILDSGFHRNGLDTGYLSLMIGYGAILAGPTQYKYSIQPS